MRWAKHVASTGEMRDEYKSLVRKPEGKKHRHRWEHNIKIGLTQIGWEAVDWILLTQNMDQWQALVNMIMNLLVP
jgi:hypothetical protein